MLSPALHRPPDPERSRDPRIRALVTRLRTLDDPHASPEPDFRSELRAQLVAIAPRVVEEGERPARRRPTPGPRTATASSDRTSATAATAARTRRRIRLARPLAVAAGVLTVFALLLGGAVWISQRALPGDALYGLKRASENVQESLSGSDTDRAKLQLQFAKTRYDEVLALLPDAKTTTEPSSQTASLIGTALSSADSDLTSAMRTLGAKAVQDKSGKDLAVVVSWAKQPLAQLAVKALYLPKNGPLQKRMVTSWTLLKGAQQQAKGVSSLHCTACFAHLRTNELGPVAPALSGPTKGTSGGTHQNGTGGTNSSQPSPTTTGSASATTEATVSALPSSGPSSAESTPAAGGLPGILPSLPAAGLPSESQSCPGVDVGVISVGECGIAVDPSP